VTTHGSVSDDSVPEGKGKEGNREQGEEGSKRPKAPTPNKAKGTLLEIKGFAIDLGLPASDGEFCFHKWEGSGWRNGGNLIKDWRSTMRAWKTAGYMPSQKNGGRPPAPHAGIQTPGKFEMP
jgi:hypothetical protein